MTSAPPEVAHTAPDHDNSGTSRTIFVVNQACSPGRSLTGFPFHFWNVVSIFSGLVGMCGTSYDEDAPVEKVSS